MLKIPVTFSRPLAAGCLFFSFLCFPRIAAAKGLEVMGKLDMFGGQYFFEGQSGALNGYGLLDLQLAKSYSSDSGFFISGRSAYTGFKQVNELAGGGTLFQQSLDNSLGFKWIKRYEGGFALKPRVGVKSQLFRETKDEKWGHGLYDFRRYEAGLTFERKTRLGLSTPWLYQLSWDAYYTSYVRFKSLASQYGQELSSPDPGTKTLDTLTNQFSYDSELDLPGFMRADIFFAVSLIDFQDQKVINSAGGYLSANRSDSFQTFSLGLSKRYNDFSALGGIRPVLGAGVALSNLISNQNHLDTDPLHLRFTSGYYDYWETRVSPNAQLTFLSSRLTARLSYDFAMRRYASRLAQRSDGSYMAKKLSQFSHALGAELALPLSGALDLKVQGNWSSSSSNNRYEQVYRYSYDSSMYFAGLEWRF